MSAQKRIFTTLLVLFVAAALCFPTMAAEVHPLAEGKTSENPIENPRIAGSSEGLAPITDRPDLKPKGTSTDLSFFGPFSFLISNGLVDMSVGRVENNSPGGSISGTIELWLWASTSIPSGGTISGHALTKWRPSTWQGVNGNQLMGGFQVSNIDLVNLPYTAPPANCYYISILLEEWNGSEFVYHDFWTYTTEPFGLGGGSCAGPPSAPSGLNAIATSSSSIDIFWNDNSDNEDEFRVEMSSNGSGFQDIGSVTADSIGASITNLNPNTTYSFRVRAYSNLDGYSGYSNTASATTLSDSDCVNDLNNGVVCLRNGRFELRGTWTDFSNPPITNPLIWTPQQDINATAGFQNNPSGIQIVMRVADACSLTGTYWLWLGGFTDAGWDITVRDTVTGNTRTWIRNRSSGNFPSTTRDTLTFSCN